MFKKKMDAILTNETLASGQIRHLYWDYKKEGKIITISALSEALALATEGDWGSVEEVNGYIEKARKRFNTLRIIERKEKTVGEAGSLAARVRATIENRDWEAFKKEMDAILKDDTLTTGQIKNLYSDDKRGGEIITISALNKAFALALAKEGGWGSVEEVNGYIEKARERRNGLERKQKRKAVGEVLGSVSGRASIEEEDIEMQDSDHDSASSFRARDQEAAAEALHLIEAEDNGSPMEIDEGGSGDPDGLPKQGDMSREMKGLIDIYNDCGLVVLVRAVPALRRAWVERLTPENRPFWLEQLREIAQTLEPPGEGKRYDENGIDENALHQLLDRYGVCATPVNFIINNDCSDLYEEVDQLSHSGQKVVFTTRVPMQMGQVDIAMEHTVIFEPKFDRENRLESFMLIDSLKDEDKLVTFAEWKRGMEESGQGCCWTIVDESRGEQLDHDMLDEERSAIQATAHGKRKDRDEEGRNKSKRVRVMEASDEESDGEMPLYAAKADSELEELERLLDNMSLLDFAGFGASSWKIGKIDEELEITDIRRLAPDDRNRLRHTDEENKKAVEEFFASEAFAKAMKAASKAVEELGMIRLNELPHNLFPYEGSKRSYLVREFKLQGKDEYEKYIGIYTAVLKEMLREAYENAHYGKIVICEPFMGTGITSYYLHNLLREFEKQGVSISGFKIGERQKNFRIELNEYKYPLYLLYKQIAENKDQLLKVYEDYRKGVFDFIETIKGHSVEVIAEKLREHLVNKAGEIFEARSKRSVYEEKHEFLLKELEKDLGEEIHGAGLNDDKVKEFLKELLSGRPSFIKKDSEIAQRIEKACSGKLKEFNQHYRVWKEANEGKEAIEFLKGPLLDILSKESSTRVKVKETGDEVKAAALYLLTSSLTSGQGTAKIDFYYSTGQRKILINEMALTAPYVTAGMKSKVGKGVNGHDFYIESLEIKMLETGILKEAYIDRMHAFLGDKRVALSNKDAYARINELYKEIIGVNGTGELPILVLDPPYYSIREKYLHSSNVFRYFGTPGDSEQVDEYLRQYFEDLTLATKMVGGKISYANMTLEGQGSGKIEETQFIRDPGIELISAREFVTVPMKKFPMKKSAKTSKRDYMSLFNPTAREVGAILKAGASYVVAKIDKQVVRIVNKTKRLTNSERTLAAYIAYRNKLQQQEQRVVIKEENISDGEMDIDSIEQHDALAYRGASNEQRDCIVKAGLVIIRDAEAREVVKPFLAGMLHEDEIQRAERRVKRAERELRTSDNQEEAAERVEQLKAELEGSRISDVRLVETMMDFYRSNSYVPLNEREYSAISKDDQVVGILGVKPAANGQEGRVVQELSEGRSFTYPLGEEGHVMSLSYQLGEGNRYELWLTGVVEIKGEQKTDKEYGLMMKLEEADVKVLREAGFDVIFFKAEKEDTLQSAQEKAFGKEPSSNAGQYWSEKNFDKALEKYEETLKETRQSSIMDSNMAGADEAMRCLLYVYKALLKRADINLSGTEEEIYAVLRSDIEKETYKLADQVKARAEKRGEYTEAEKTFIEAYERWDAMLADKRPQFVMALREIIASSREQTIYQLEHFTPESAAHIWNASGEACRAIAVSVPTGFRFEFGRFEAFKELRETLGFTSLGASEEAGHILLLERRKEQSGDYKWMLKDRQGEIVLKQEHFIGGLEAVLEHGGSVDVYPAYEDGEMTEAANKWIEANAGLRHYESLSGVSDSQQTEKWRYISSAGEVDRIWVGVGAKVVPPTVRIRDMVKAAREGVNNCDAFKKAMDAILTDDTLTHAQIRVLYLDNNGSNFTKKSALNEALALATEGDWGSVEEVN
ncbi:MAG: hypothetical protein V4664_03945, partial [Patescibacteria group bacterium]